MAQSGRVQKQQATVLTRIREMILQGHLEPGQRVPEAQVAEMLGLSRTPVRQALPVLAQEGLLIESGGRGFAVRGFSVEEIAQAIDVRGTLEGLAARGLAERGAPQSLLDDLQALLHMGDRIFAKRHLVVEDEQSYGEMNLQFHDCIINAAQHPVVSDLLARVNRIPFASPATIAFDRLNLEQMFEALWHAHRQHHDIVHALQHREGARVEALFREHVNSQKHSMNLRRPAVIRDRFDA